MSLNVEVGVLRRSLNKSTKRINMEIVKTFTNIIWKNLYTIVGNESSIMRICDE
jgi:hypothetical protein